MRTLLSAFWLFVAVAASSAETDFALQDRDTVVFLGDRITAARGYTKIVELYTLMRSNFNATHPKRASLDK